MGNLYGLVMVFVIAYLWYSGRWNQKAGLAVLFISAALGFLIFSPVMPYQFEQIALRNEAALQAPVAVAAAGFTITLVIVFVFGRFFCGYLCPAGAVQEIAYHVPVKKVPVRLKVAFMIIRAAFSILFLVLAFASSFSLLAFFGIRDFFSLVPATAALVFLILILAGTAVYRPFCRLFCPAGFLFSLAGWKGILKIRRTDTCISCKKCEKACPADVAGRDDPKAECYLCGRCMEACQTEGALRYGKR
jgi:ferredoxin-type protein NapH